MRGNVTVGNIFLVAVNMLSSLSSPYSILNYPNRYLFLFRRICDKLVSGDDLEFHVAKEHPKKNFAETEIIFNIKDESGNGDKTANRRGITSNGEVEDDVEDQNKTLTLQLTMGEISGLVENNREILECIQRSNKVIITIKGTTVIISGKPESLENAKLRLMNFQKEIFSVKVSENEAKIVIGRNNKNLKMIAEVSGARLYLKDGEEVIVRGKEAAVMKAKSMLERILDRNITGRNHLQYRKELQVGDKFSFVLSSKEIRSILGVKGTNIEAIRDAANAIIHCKKYNGEEKLILEGSEDAKNKAKTLIERVLSKEVTMKLSYKQTVNIFQFLERLTTSTGAIINQVFKGSKEDFCGGLSIIGSEMQVKQAVQMVRDMLGDM